VSAASDEVLVNLYERVSPGVVSLLVATSQGGGEGSGFVFDKSGHIITNYHVVEGATEIEVHFLSGLKVRGKVVGNDPDSDLAVVKVTAPERALIPLALADSNQLKVGQTVVAIGNPFGLAGTMTVGIVSAKGRTLGSLRQAPGGSLFSSGAIIQTDASINPGNSGGPLLNLKGEVVGVNRAIRTTSTTAQGDPVNSGIGFAIASNIVRRVAPVIIEKGKYDYPYLGVTSRDALPLAVLEALGLQRMTGAYVIEVAAGSPAEKAGLVGGTRNTSIAGLKAGGDLIIAIDGQPVQTFADLLGYLMTSKSPGDTVSLLILRDNKEQEVKVTLAKRP
jgi:2-alkenal reductase